MIMLPQSSVLGYTFQFAKYSWLQTLALLITDTKQHTLTVSCVERLLTFSCESSNSCFSLRIYSMHHRTSVIISTRKISARIATYTGVDHTGHDHIGVCHRPTRTVLHLGDLACSIECGSFCPHMSQVTITTTTTTHCSKKRLGPQLLNLFNRVLQSKTNRCSTNWQKKEVNYRKCCILTSDKCFSSTCTVTHSLMQCMHI